MEAATILAGHWLEILVAVYLLGMILYGHYRGFIRLAVSAAALLITLIGVKLVLPYVTEWVKNETPVYEMVQDSMEKAIGMDEFLTEDPEVPWQGNTEEETSAIESLELPGLLKEARRGAVPRLYWKVPGGAGDPDCHLCPAVSCRLYPLADSCGVAGSDGKASNPFRDEPDCRRTFGRRRGSDCHLAALPFLHGTFGNGSRTGRDGADCGKQVAVIFVPAQSFSQSFHWTFEHGCLIAHCTETI